MTTATPELPRLTALAVVLVTAAGIASLAAVRPVLGAGALVGVALGVAVRGLGRSPLWTMVATAALPPGLVGVVATLLLSGSLTGVPLTLAAIVVGISTVSVLAGRLTARQVGLVTVTGAVSALVMVPAAVLTLEIQSAGGVSAVVGGLLWYPGDGVAGLVVWLLTTGVAVTLALLTLPPAIAANLRGQPLELPQDSGTTARAVTVALVLGLVLAAGALGGAGAAVRGVLLGVTVLSVCVSGLGALAWVLSAGGTQRNRGDPPLVALGTGALVGATVVSGFAIIVDSGSSQSPLTVFLPTIAALALVSVTAGWVANRFSLGDALGRNRTQLRRRQDRQTGYGSPGDARAGAGAGVRTTVSSTSYPRSPSSPSLSLPLPGQDVVRPDTLIPVGLVGAAVLTALWMDRTPGLDQVGVLVAIAAALFVRALFSRGRASSGAVGVENVARLTQSIWLGWAGALAGVGLAVGAVGLLLAAVLPVTLSVPATVGVVSSLVAFVTGIWLLVQ